MLEDFNFASFKEKFKKEKRFKIIVISAGSLLVTALLIFGYYKFFYQPAENESQAMYVEAINSSNDLARRDSVKWVLEGINAQVESESKKDSLLKYNTMLEDLDARISKQIRLLESNVEEYEGHGGELASKFVLATYYMKNNQTNEALELLKTLEVNDIILSSMIPGLKGDCYSDLGNYSEAYNQYAIAYNTNINDFTTPMYLWKAGLVAEKLNQFEEAANCFRKLKREYATNPYVQTKRLDFHLEKSKLSSVR